MTLQGFKEFNSDISANIHFPSYWWKNKKKVTLYLKPSCIMHYNSSFNALFMQCNTPYNALYNLMNICNHS